jgi:hypothetical protein
MALGLEDLLIALVFLLPGFLTSWLIAARTPAVGRQVSTFQETLESLLRSVCIHLVIAPLVFIMVRFILIRDDAILISRLYSEGLKVYYDVRPLEVSIVLFGWLVGAFLIALIFGCKWDPIETVLENLASKTGTLSEDPLYLLRQVEIERRNQGKGPYGLWIQARLKNGYTYRGEYWFAGYRGEKKSRELILANVKFFPYAAQTTDDLCLPPRSYDFVFLDTANCESLEVLLTKDESEGMSKSDEL